MSTAAIVADILNVAFGDARSVVDVTYGLGKFWDGSAHVRVTAHDLDPARAPDGPADFRALPYGNETFDVVLFDPPHVADGGKASIMARRYGTFKAAEHERAVRAGVAEAWRVARLGIITKIADHTHGQRLLLESDWVRSTLDNRAPYEIVYQTRRRSIVDPRWRAQLSAYNNGATFLAFRKGDQRHIARACRA